MSHELELDISYYHWWFSNKFLPLPLSLFLFKYIVNCFLFFSEVKEIKQSVIPLSIPILDVEIIAQHGRGVKRCH